MHAGLPGEALQFHGDVEEMPDLWFRVVALLKLGFLLKDILDVDLGIVAGHQLGDGRAFLERHSQHTTHVMDDGFGLHLAECGNLGH